MTNEFVLLWSQSQNCFHIERVGDMLKANARAFTENRPMDYVTMLLGPEDACHTLADQLRPHLRGREIPLTHGARRAVEAMCRAD